MGVGGEREGEGEGGGKRTLLGGAGLSASFLADSVKLERILIGVVLLALLVFVVKYLEIRFF